MLYSTEMMRKAMSLARHAYSDHIDRKGRSLFLLACARAEKMKTEKETVIALLKMTMEETNLTLNEVKQAGFEDAIINALPSGQSAKKCYVKSTLESLTA